MTESHVTNYSPMEIIRTVIKDSPHEEFTINQNYELIDENDANLLNPKLLDPKMLLRFFNGLYASLGSFVLSDVSADFHMFRRRLDDLSFLKARHNEKTLTIKKLYRALGMAENDHVVPIQSIRIDCLTMRVYDEVGEPLHGKAFMDQAIRVLLKGFCLQLEVSKEELLTLAS